MRAFTALLVALIILPAVWAQQEGINMPTSAKDQKQAQSEDTSAMQGSQMNPYFTGINYPIPKDTMMVMLLRDFQSARTGPNFFTVMAMAEYGITSRWSAGVHG